MWPHCSSFEHTVYSHLLIKFKILPMMSYVSLMSAAKRKSNSLSLSPLPKALAFWLNLYTCVFMHKQHISLFFVLYQSMSICEQHCSVCSRVAALLLSVTSASVKHIMHPRSSSDQHIPPVIGLNQARHSVAYPINPNQRGGKPHLKQSKANGSHWNKPQQRERVKFWITVDKTNFTQTKLISCDSQVRKWWPKLATKQGISLIQAQHSEAQT